MSSIAAAQDFGFGPARRVGGTAPLRLTRRGRLTLLAVFLDLALAVMSLLGGHSAATDEAGAPVATRTVVVGEGDTLWGIASEVAEPGGVREMVHYLQELNALPSPSLALGQKISVPAE